MKLKEKEADGKMVGKDSQQRKRDEVKRNVRW